MHERDLIRLRHMLDAAEEAVNFIVGRKREDLDTDRMLALTLVRSIEIVGEAGPRVSEGGRTEVPDIPWREIVAVRNRPIHAYFDVDLDVVWRTVKDDLPPLIATLKNALLQQENYNGE